MSALESALDSIHRQAFSGLGDRRQLPQQVDPLARVDLSIRLPSDVIIQSGAYVPAGTIIESGCHIGPNVALVDGAPIVLKRGVHIGANATLLPGITIAAKAVVRPGSVVQRSVPPGAIVEGNPAAIVGYVDTQTGPVSLLQSPSAARSPRVEALPVRGVTLHHFPVIPDLRGNLTVGEFQRQIPFDPLRYFIVFGVPSREVRGEHAHRQCHQFLICLRGSCAVVADDGAQRVEVLLDAPERGLYLPPMTWGIQYKYSADAMLLVFASQHYDAADYIREHDEFLAAVAAVESA
jgi:UDP-2-acetamido-3-amino-2,3-dideoxy-glucuronate N-acetyltransferase